MHTESGILMSTSAELPRIGVVIPYFQRQTGLLHRALSSIRVQEYAPIQVVVVDDGSPRAATEEITATLRKAVPGLTVVRQVNQGAAAARNTALDAMREEVTAIAFLDSDDYWEPAHLRNAAVALSQGADFFFANFRFEGTTMDQFRRQERRDLLDHPRPVPEAPGIMHWAGSVPGLMLPKCSVQTSGVVFRRAIMPQVRFPRTLRGPAGAEDHWVWWALLVRSSAVMYCPEPTLTYGTGGMGFWQHSASASVRFLVLRADEIRKQRHVLKNYPMSSGERRLLLETIAMRREEALVSALALLRRRQKHALKEIVYLLRDDPLCAASWCVTLPKLLYRRVRRASVTSVRQDSQGVR